MKSILASMALALAVPASLSAQTISNYQYVVSSQSPTAYFKLDSSLQSAVNGSVVLEAFAGGYATDAYRNVTNCWYFVDQNTSYLRNLTDSLINGGGTANSNAIAKGSITFLFRMLSGPNIGGQRFLFDATTTGGMGTTNHNALALYLENDTSTNDANGVKLRFGDSTTTLLLSNNIVRGAWYYFALTYDEARFPNKANWLSSVESASTPGAENTKRCPEKLVSLSIRNRKLIVPTPLADVSVVGPPPAIKSLAMESESLVSEKEYAELALPK